ncbi:hypothetical protein ACSQ67_010923 [Phaseolus vulgaris]
MGVASNPKVFLSDKDIKGPNILDPELGLLLHNQGCQAFIQEDHHLIKLKQLSVQERDQREEDNKDHNQEEQKQQQRNNILVTNTLKLEILSSYVASDNEDDGYATPTSSDKKVPAILECPGAPKKSKAKAAMKRKACGRRIVLDLPQDLESLFPAPCVLDLAGGGVNKRVKHC